MCYRSYFCHRRINRQRTLHPLPKRHRPTNPKNPRKRPRTSRPSKKLRFNRLVPNLSKILPRIPPVPAPSSPLRPQSNPANNRPLRKTRRRPRRRPPIHPNPQFPAQRGRNRHEHNRIIHRKYRRRPRPLHTTVH